MSTSSPFDWPLNNHLSLVDKDYIDMSDSERYRVKLVMESLIAKSSLAKPKLYEYANVRLPYSRDPHYYGGLSKEVSIIIGESEVSENVKVENLLEGEVDVLSAAERINNLVKGENGFVFDPVTPIIVSFVKEHTTSGPIWRKKSLPKETLYRLFGASVGKTNKLNILFEYSSASTGIGGIVNDTGICEMPLKEAEEKLINFKDSIMMSLMLTKALSEIMVSMKLVDEAANAKTPKKRNRKTIQDNPLFGSW